MAVSEVTLFSQDVGEHITYKLLFWSSVDVSFGAPMRNEISELNSEENGQ